MHNRYRQRSGEDIVFDAESTLLEQRGHQVSRFFVDNAELPSSLNLVDQVRLAKTTVWSHAAAREIRPVIRRVRPDIVHVHNTLPLLSPSIYEACAREGTPVVQTLHNYRLVCAKSSLFRNGRPCEDCVGRTVPWPGFIHACYQDSRIKSAPVVAMLGLHNARNTWRHVSVFVALSEYARRFFVRAGLPPERVVVKPNFVEPDPGARRSVGRNFVFVGRLSPEKGVDTLLKAWQQLPRAVRLTIIGDGPMRARVEEAASTLDNVVFVGPQDRSSVLQYVASARGVIVPSEWYEAPLTVIEAFACGVPVIASRFAVLAEVIEHERTGLLFRVGDPVELADAVRWLNEHPTEAATMGAAGRREYVARYTADEVYRRLIEIYRTHALAR